MTNLPLDEEKLSDIMQQIMLESVAEEVDMSDPKEQEEFVSQIVERELGPNHPQLNDYKQTLISDMYREETLDKVGREGYYKRMRGARANEYKNLDATRK